MRSSRLLTTDDWPEAELRAAVLAGELVAVGACWASVAEPQDPALRAASFAWSAADPRVIAAGRSAAWVWGACSRPPLPHEACVPAGQRIRQDGDVRIREVAIVPADVVRIGGASVTTPVRTALDLLRVAGPAAWAGRAAVVHGLLVAGTVSAADVSDALRALGTVPMVRQAERRLAEVSRR
ncbi:type IV toxin-antitoxin system AbiEi family antitoxin [Curtobacterium sp. MCLR17_007]|uniref:type IV toxin-antitoxin system AbiEi family antitoxin n=1 Tax=unclassified Curtobacterium TaxID=257496 RepID=UPI0006F64DB0|nr:MULTISPECIES: type IV toxin-antitoxin system AbiEi family antitoxin [unclassified Curtobacterium]KQS07889.1 hypothetical protein ASG04_11985 [Curtobacterium sp. Leaf183]WIB58648.1 type IV toxin-antitoxin system AbiEi family antitoxin [Curtobacterium sp. MCLR17_007]